MKPTRILTVDGKPLHLVEENIALQISTPGVGFMTIEADAPLAGKRVELSIGYNGQVMPWFSGYVESDAEIDKKLRKCLVREAAAVLMYPLNISEQHPTLQRIAMIITEKTGISVQLPAASYRDRPIPHLKHNGNGLQLLNMLGRVFSIDDYVWYSSTAGAIYAGSYADCRFAGKPVDLPVDFISSDSAANGWRIPVIASMRPGVILNGHRVTRVQLHQDDMTVHWDDRREPVLKQQIDSLYPEIGTKTHLPRFARVLNHTEETKNAQIADPYRPKYAVDLQLLDEDGKPTDTPIYRAVPLPVPMAGSECGMFQYPHPGTMVELGHIDGRQDKPTIRAIHAQGHNLPAVKPGEQLQQLRAEVFQRVHVDGSWQRETDQTIREKSTERHVEHQTETRQATERETTITATDKTTVLGTSTLLAGEIQQVADGDYSQAATKNWIAHADNCHFDIHQVWQTKTRTTEHTCDTLTERIAQVRQSVAGQLQKICAPLIQLDCTTLQVTGSTLTVGSSGQTDTATIAAGKISVGDRNTTDCDMHGNQVWMGSQQINTLQLMLDLCDVIQQLAIATANHTHPYVPTPTNASQIASAGSQAASLKNKYGKLIK